MWFEARKKDNVCGTFGISRLDILQNEIMIMIYGIKKSLESLTDENLLRLYGQLGHIA